jgi:ACR3 family arsenite transporter
VVVEKMSQRNQVVIKATKHLKTYLLAYSILAMIIGLIIGYEYRAAFQAHQSLVKNTIVLLAILTIYPSMIQLRLEELGNAAKKLKAVIVGSVMVFVAAPVLAILMAGVFPEKQVSMGFVLTNTVPASSASIGYVLITGGNIELATILAIVTLFGAFATIPGYMGLYARVASVHVPMGLVMKSLGITLLTPLVLGQLTRYYLVHHRARKAVEKGCKRYPCIAQASQAYNSDSCEGDLLHRIVACVRKQLEKELKPHLSLWTMVTMLVLIALLVAAKAGKIVAKPELALEIFGAEAAMLFTLLGLVTVIDKLLGMNYEDHMAIAFLSATKNASVAAAIAVTALSPMAALPAALIPVIQAPVAISYVQISPKLRRIFPSAAEAEAEKKETVAVAKQ